MVASFLATAGQAAAQALPQMLPAITSLASNWGGGTDIGSSKKLMKWQADLWKENTAWYNDNVIAHAYKTTRNSLEEAGYNPLMALSNGAMYDQGAMPNASANSSAKGISMNQLVGSQIANTNADTMLKGAQTEQATSSSNLLNQQRETEYFNTQIKEIQKRQEEIREKLLDKDLSWKDRLNYAEMLNKLKQTQKDYVEMWNLVTTGQAKAVEASAKDFEARHKGFTTSTGIHGPFGMGINFSHTGSPNGYTKIREGKYVKRYEIINGRRIPVTTYQGY